ncbi:hypothetical protein [Terracidiphilus gabretensis]|jgi:hypothetical protein|uniref:hypothetical protein n=1 Tax=Terracidiphilus gabretensis TaxID=1577687 RepID=UPI00071B0044|nr:hypothetical protein [Terracidiphilus gabretensis]
MKFLHWLGFILIGVVLIILAANGFIFMWTTKATDPGVFIAITLTSLFVLATTTTFAIILLWGSGQLTLDVAFVKWLGGATVAEVAGILTIIVNFYFAKPAQAPAQPQPASIQQQGTQPPQPATQVQAPSKAQ